MLYSALGVIPESGSEWWVIALLGVLSLLLVAAIVMMFCAAFDHSEPEAEPEPEVKNAPPVDFVNEPEEDDDDDDDDDDEEEDDDDDDENELPAGSLEASREYTTIYNRSFMARLSQSSVEQKNRYNEIKNHILSYKKVKSRVSWGFDSFNTGRNRLIRLQCKGKNLMMYIALDPAQLDAKYKAKDMSSVIRYQTVPARVKIKSDRTLRYAIELVDKLMEENGIVADGKYEAADFSVPYMDTETLIANKLIKTRETSARPFYQQ